MIVTSQQIGAASAAPDPDEALSHRLRDLALVELDALCAGTSGDRAAALAGAYADDVADALREARTRITSDAAVAGAARVRDRLTAQAEASRALARLAELAAGLVPKLFEAERRR
jgi:hypothetical protein